MHWRVVVQGTLGVVLTSCGNVTVSPRDAGLAPDGASAYDAPSPPSGCTPQTQVAAQCADGFCEVPAGCFLMGSPPDDPCRDADESQHFVTLTHAVLVAQTETTQAEFQTVMGYDPTRFPSCGGDCAVDNVTWHMAVAYANAVSDRAGLAACYACTGDEADVSCTTVDVYAGPTSGISSCPGYRLPTEAEFEHVYRAGATTGLYSGDVLNCYDVDPNADAIGWYIFNTAASAGPHPVGAKQPNGWGLSDIAGNLEEWVHDGYAAYPDIPVIDPDQPFAGEDARSARGGSWFSYPKDMRGANRNRWTGTEAHGYRGFRVVRTAW